MTTGPRIAWLALLLAATAAGGTFAHADTHSSWESASREPTRPIRFAAAGVSMDQAVKMAEKRFNARVVRAESQQDGGHTIYVLRLLNDSGRVWTVRVDASSGQVL